MYNDIPENADGYTDSFFRPLNVFMEELRREGEAQNIPMIRKDAEMLLKSLLTLKKPRRILEVGTAHGYSALFFAMIRPEADIVSLEIRKEYVAKATLNIKKADALAHSGRELTTGHPFSGRITILHGDAGATLARMSAEGTKPFDMVFMDGPKSHYLRHFQLIHPLLAAGALIVSDNILLGGMLNGKVTVSRRNMTMVRRMEAYLKYITCLPGYETAVLALGDGIAITAGMDGVWKEK